MYPKPIALTQQGPHKKTYLHYTQRCKTKQKTNWTRVSVKACHQINNLSHIFSSVQISLSVMFISLQPHGLQHTRLPCPSSSPGACSNSCPYSQWCNPVNPLLSLSPPAFNFSNHQGLFQWVSFSHQVAKVLELQFQHQSFQWIFRTDFL